MTAGGRTGFTEKHSISLARSGFLAGQHSTLQRIERFHRGRPKGVWHGPTTRFTRGGRPTSLRRADGTGRPAGRQGASRCAGSAGPGGAGHAACLQRRHLRRRGNYPAASRGGRDHCQSAPRGLLRHSRQRLLVRPRPRRCERWLVVRDPGERGRNRRCDSRRAGWLGLPHRRDLLASPPPSRAVTNPFTPPDPPGYDQVPQQCAHTRAAPLFGRIEDAHLRTGCSTDCDPFVRGERVQGLAGD